MKKKTTDRKSTERKSTRRSRKKSPAVVSKPSNPGRKHELIGLAFLAVGLISICGLFGLNVGFVGVYFAKCLHYLFGVGAILVSLLILLIGYQYIVKHHGLVYSLRFFGMGLLFVSLLAIWHHFAVPVGAEIMPDSLPRGGGLLGGGLLFCLRKFFGVDGSIILLGAGAVGSILLSTTWSLAAGLLKTQETAAKGANVAGEAVSAAYGKVADVSERVEEHVVEKVKAKVRDSFYNQEQDNHFANATESELQPKEENTESPIRYGLEPDIPTLNDTDVPAEPVAEPEFTIDYGRPADGSTAETGVEPDFEPLPTAVTAPYTSPVVEPSAQPMKKKRTAMPDYADIAPVVPAAALLDGSAAAKTAACSAACARLAKLFHPFNGTDDVGKAHAKLFVDDHGFAARHEFAVDIDFQRLAGQLVQFHHRTLPQLQQFVDEQAGAPKLGRHVQRNVQNKVQFALELVVGWLPGHFRHVLEMGLGRMAAHASPGPAKGLMPRRALFLGHAGGPLGCNHLIGLALRVVASGRRGRRSGGFSRAAGISGCIRLLGEFGFPLGG